MVKKRTTLSLDAEAYASFQKLVPNVSAKVDEFIKSELVRLAGQAPEGREQYEPLKKEHSQLSGECQRKRESLIKDKELFDQANELLFKLGLKEDLSNLDDVMPRFMNEWDGCRDFSQEYISLLELTRKKLQVGKKLTELRAIKSTRQGQSIIEAEPCADSSEGLAPPVTVEKDIVARGT